MIVRTTLTLSVSFLHEDTTPQDTAHDALLQALRAAINQRLDLYSFIAAYVMAARTEPA